MEVGREKASTETKMEILTNFFILWAVTEVGAGQKAGRE